jgi:DNA-binding response OmpR family regulator
VTPYILLIEDDKDIQGYVKGLLVDQGFLVGTASKGVQALSLIQEKQPDLVMLDLMLPDVQGEGVCAEIRNQNPDLPIIILTAKDSTGSKVEALNMGADDYITKPFAPEELVARVKARLRHTGTGEQSKLVIADLELDPKTIRVTRGGEEIKLTPREFTLLEYLMHNKNMVLSREMILDRVWSYSLEIESRVVDVYMGYLRTKIDKGQKRKLIQSVRGFGYMIKD